MRSHPVKDGSTLGDVTMAVDRGYGSGKPRSAANSAARRRVAAGQMTKSKKGNAALKKIAAQNPVTGFISGGVSVTKLYKVAQGLTALGKTAQAAAVRSRAVAKVSGGLPPTTSSGMYSSYGQEAREALRNQSSSVFPRLNPFSGNTKTALINEIKQSVRSIQKKDMTRGTRFINKPR